MMHPTPHNRASMQVLVAANRSAGRLDAPVAPDDDAPDSSTVMLPTGMRLWPHERAQADTLAKADARSRAWFCRQMYLRGLQAYLAEYGAGAAGAAQ